MGTTVIWQLTDKSARLKAQVEDLDIGGPELSEKVPVTNLYCSDLVSVNARVQAKSFFCGAVNALVPCFCLNPVTVSMMTPKLWYTGAAVWPTYWTSRAQHGSWPAMASSKPPRLQCRKSSQWHSIMHLLYPHQIAMGQLVIYQRSIVSIKTYIHTWLVHCTVLRIPSWRSWSTPLANMRSKLSCPGPVSLILLWKLLYSVTLADCAVTRTPHIASCAISMKMSRQLHQSSSASLVLLQATTYKGLDVTGLFQISGNFAAFNKDHERRMGVVIPCGCSLDDDSLEPVSITPNTSWEPANVADVPSTSATFLRSPWQ